MNSKRLVLILAAIIPVCILVLVAVLFLPRGTAPNNSGISSSSGSSSNTATDGSFSSQSILTEYKLAGIRTNDSVVLTEEQKAQVVVQLDNRNWQTPQWQPERKVLAVLGNTSTAELPVYNIFIFDPAKNTWMQITSYDQATGGISAFKWFGNTNLAFTQGSEGNNWLHNLDYVNNQLTKVFQTAGKLIDNNSDGYLFLSGNNLLRWQDTKGNNLIQYNVNDIEANAKIMQAGLNNQNQAWMLVQTSTQQIMYVFATAGDITPTEVLRLRLGAQTVLGTCEIGSNFFFVQARNNNLQILNLANTNQAVATLSTNQEITKLNYQVTCGNQTALIRIYGGESNQWYQFTGSRLENIPNFDNLASIATL